MDAKAKKVREILHAGDQYLIPFFQRYYSWTRQHAGTVKEALDAKTAEAESLRAECESLRARGEQDR